MRAHINRNFQMHAVIHAGQKCHATAVGWKRVVVRLCLQTVGFLKILTWCNWKEEIKKRETWWNWTFCYRCFMHVNILYKDCFVLFYKYKKWNHCRENRSLLWCWLNLPRGHFAQSNMKINLSVLPWACSKYKFYQCTCSLSCFFF